MDWHQSSDWFIESHHYHTWSSLVVQMVKILPAMWKTRVQSLGQEDPLKKGMATHSSILAWKTPWTEETRGQLSMGSHRIRQDWVTNTFTFTLSYCFYTIYLTISKKDQRVLQIWKFVCCLTNKIDWRYSQSKIFCAFCVYMCIFRVNKLADSKMESQPIQSLHLMCQRSQNRNQSKRVFRNYERPVITRLNEIANIKFNTGVSIFTKNVKLVYLAWVYILSELKRCLECGHRRVKQIWNSLYYNSINFLMQEKWVLDKDHSYATLTIVISQNHWEVLFIF